MDLFLSQILVSSTKTKYYLCSQYIPMETLEKRHIEFDRTGFDDKELIEIYRKLLLPR